ncbi:MAG: hypothetical protein OEV49_07260 [candidate division Zixibacteria bacterium]|nr:hypothetical protein [candidate division Zixibacteria bacterium]MDH3937112.1 hypothetical protein [candidate division Zixibacteria bacterium]MDH4033035.1 hypothetical protein [candidate division Zixibacteria bacterium]
MRKVALIFATAVLLFGGGPALPDDKPETVVTQTWDDFFFEMQHEMFAQVEEEGEHAQMEPGKPGQRRRQRKHVEQLRMLKMLELLDLNEDQEISFLTSYNNLRGDIRRVDEARMKALTKLGGKLHDSTSSDSEIEKLLEQIGANLVEKQTVEARFLENAAAILTVRQLGKLIIFNEHFERELLDRVRVFREGKMNRQRPDGP